MTEENTNISPNDILAQLDGAARDYTFPVLDNGYVFIGKSRLNAFRTEQDWAIVFELLGYYTREYQFENRLYAFGSSVANPGIGTFLIPFVTDKLAVLGTDHAIDPGLTSIQIRGDKFEFSLTPQFFSGAGVTCAATPLIHASEFLRAICHYRSHDLWATDIEVQNLTDLYAQKILVLDEWEHPDISDDQMPSETKTFQMLATVLSTGNVGEYDANLVSPNTHWTNWPEGGLL